MEKYKNIIGYEGLYQVSNMGNIKSLIGRYKNVSVLKQGFDANGYKVVSLCKNKVKKTKSVHRLVMEAFKGRSKLQVNHIDLDKSNNNIANLEYLTAKENIRHAMANGALKFNTQKIAEQKRKVVLQIDPKTNKIVNRFISAHEAAKITGFNRGNICSTCRGNGKLVNKFDWKYE